ncbi:MAG: AI-2E family transporter [Lewinellaceae bacterium]|nr:AI-2E family transporter [Lewinellaceae bacterium]
MQNTSWTRYAAIGLSLALVAFLIYRFSNIVSYVLIAWVLSLMGAPLMRLFQKIRLYKWQVGVNLAAVMTMISFFIVSVGLLLLFVPVVLEQAGNLANVDYASIAQALEEPYEQMVLWLNNHGLTLEQGTLEDLVKSALSGRFEPAKIGSVLTDFIAAAGNIVIGLFSVIFITFFFLREQGMFSDFILSLVPTRFEGQTREAIDDSVFMLSRYFSGLLLQMTVITIFVSLLLGILGVKNALLIGFFAAVMNLIPYLGPLLGAAFGVFITISSNLDLEFYNQMVPLLIKVMVVFGGMQMLDNYLLQPYIFSTSVMAHPLEIFIVVLIGANLQGITGMILAIPVYTILRVLAKEFFQQFKIVQKLTRQMKDSGV